MKQIDLGPEEYERNGHKQPFFAQGGRWRLLLLVAAIAIAGIVGTLSGRFDI